MPEAWIPLVAQEVERAGFEGFWYGDHVAAPIEYEGNYLYSEDGRPSMRLETPIADVFLALAGAAAVTERIMLGSSVVVLPMRPPLITARAVTTLQNMSGGRFRLGIGVGWQREEFEAIGMPFDQRGKRADEILELLPKLWTGEPVEHDGLTCRFGPLRLSPPVVTKVPLLGSGTTAPALRRSARLDGWCSPPSLALQEAIDVRAALEAERAAVGRADEHFEMWVHPEGGTSDKIDAFREAGFDRFLLLPGYGRPPTTLNDCLAGVREAAEDCGLTDVSR
jgi:probable F420-dependent oxidoreductase